jgi:hypothetical protein
MMRPKSGFAMIPAIAKLPADAENRLTIAGFRNRGDDRMKTPSKAPAKTGSKAAVPTAKITVELPEPLLSALDSWIVEQTDRPSREEAVGIILLEWLASAGTRSDEDFPERRSRDRRKTPKPVATERRKSDRRGGAGTGRALRPDQLNSENDV